MMKTLFLNPPSYEGFDGGAGSRYQARREVRSFWYPTWLAQAAALVPDSTLIDAPPDDLTLEQTSSRAPRGHELIIIHTSTPSVDSGRARRRPRSRRRCPGVRIGFVGAHTMVLPEETLRAAPAVDFVTTGEFDYAVRDIAAGADYADVARHRLSHGRRPASRRTPAQPPIHDLDAFPFVIDVYDRAPDHRELLHRLPAAPLRLAVHRPRLPQPLHLLPVAADHRRPRLPHAHASSTSSPRWRTRRSSSRR